MRPEERPAALAALQAKESKPVIDERDLTFEFVSRYLFRTKRS